jgi:hypothetical protein
MQDDSSRKLVVYYQHSGKAPFTGVLLALVIGLLCGGIVAYTYGLLLAYVPLAGMVTIFFAVGFGYGVGIAAGKGLKVGRIRSQFWGLFVVAFVALVAFYISWVSWVHALLNKAGAGVSMVELLPPDVLWRYVIHVNESGVWSVRGYRPTGILLWLLWAIEAGMIFSVLFTYSRVMSSPSPYCEPCSEWCEKTTGLVRLAAPEMRGEVDAVSADLVQHLEGKDLQALETMGPPQSETTYYRIDEHHCPKCGHLWVVSLNHVSVDIDGMGRAIEKLAPLSSPLVVTAEEAAALRDLGDRLTERQMPTDKTKESPVDDVSL